MLELNVECRIQDLVSTLTGLYDGPITANIAEEGHTQVYINVCFEDMVGMWNGSFYILLEPHYIGNVPINLKASVILKASEEEGGDNVEAVCFSADLLALKTSVATYKCALHVCGDFLKFYERA